MMGIDGTLYKILLVIHVASVVVAFGPMLMQQGWMKKATRQTGEVAAATVDISQRALRLSIVGLAAALAAGIALVLTSQGGISFSEAWISASFTVVFVLVVIGAFIFRPALAELQTAISEHSPQSDAAKAIFLRANAAAGFFHLGLVLLLALMFFQPGS